MPSSTRSNKESQLIFSPDPASLERTIRKEERSLLTDNNTSVSLYSAQPPSDQTPVPSTNSRSPLSIDNTKLPSTDTLHPTSIDIPSQTSIDTEPRDMVATLILVRNNNGDLHDQQGHLHNAVGQRIDAQGAAIPEPDATTTERSEVNERANPTQKPLPGELNRYAGQLAGELNHHAGQLAGELNRRVVALARRTQPPRRSARRRTEPSRGCVCRRVQPSCESAHPAGST
ncbi:hypothetical protein DY000_02053232 [Brassica cretica]|uniref:Uncharacterized protein n=1 Tax=Brassica cretica TaxID=69181 RepID=A0ABQ7ADU6_BRACR|nr:hypothetical protein DY000_02053232 [Brassica cretica]